MSIQAAMLSTYAIAQGHTRHKRGCPRSCAGAEGDAGVRQIARRTQAGRDAVCAPEDPSSLRAPAPQGALRRARRVPPRSYRAEPEDPCQSYLATAAEHANCMRCLSVGGVQPGASGTPTLNKGTEKRTKTDPQKLK